jgi:hypothetical protein
MRMEFPFFSTCKKFTQVFFSLAYHLLELIFMRFFLCVCPLSSETDFLCTILIEDEWKNFLERVGCKNEEVLREDEQLEEKLCLWVSYRGQTLTRTGIVYLLHGCTYIFS